MNCPSCKIQMSAVINDDNKLVYINLEDKTEEQAKSWMVKTTSNLTVKPLYCNKCHNIGFEQV